MLKNNATFNKLYSSSKLCPKEDKRKVMEKEILDIREKMYNMALEYNELINVEKRAFKIDKSSLKEISNLESKKCSLQEIEDIADALCEKSGLVKSNDFTDDINDLDQQIDKIISNYTFSKSHNEIEKLTLIRNSLSHVGRVNTAFCKFGRADINFYDYDDNNHLAGYINCNYYVFIETIFRLFERKKVKVIK